MSGPWDRPSPDPGADWPSEDLDSPQTAEPREPEGDASASGDLWSESPRDAGSDWGDWPAPAPPSDEYVVDEPQPTLSDPWAESWTDESADALAPLDGPWEDRPAADVARPEEPPRPAAELQAAEPALSEPAQEQPAWFAPTAPEEVTPEEVTPEEVASEPDAPTVQAWAVDTDPWGPAAPAEEPVREAAVVPPAAPTLPDWLVEPEPEPEAEASQPAPAWTPELAPPPEPEPEPEPEREPEPELEPPAELAAGEEAAEAESAPDAGPTPDGEPALDAGASWRRFVPWAASAAVPAITPETDVTEVGPAVEPQAQPMPEAEVEPEAGPEPDVAAAAEGDAPVTEEASSPWRRLTPWATELAAASTATPEAEVAEPEPGAESEPRPEAELPADAEPEPEAEPEPASVAAADGKPEPPPATVAPLEADAVAVDESSPWHRIAPWLAAPAASELAPEPEASAEADIEAAARAEEEAEVPPPPEPEPEVAADAEVAAEAQPQPEAEVAAEAQPEPAADAVAEGEPPVQPAGTDEGDSTSPWRRLAPWVAGAAAGAAAGPAAGAAAATPEPEAVEADEGLGAEDDTDPIAALRTASPWAEPEVVDSPVEPEPGLSPADAWGAVAEPQPDVVEAAPQPEPTGEGVPESTQVFPTSWTPPPPPSSAETSRTLEPVAGDVRTRLATPEPDLDEDLEPEASTAEQAVPWLIGFILLLAGMVIVLLALIFAGDQSLSAGLIDPSASASALPSVLATVVPSRSPSPSATAAPSASQAASPTPVPAPEYGALEMIYQGRAAALAPIYLLRHDFTTEDEPVTLAQDDSLDVRRFAWTRDGTVGAGLLADVLVSIEEGQEKRRLGDGIMTITFGEDASTVYAVRVTEDGANDVATVLAVDFASGDTKELASINYPRPDVAAEEGLAEAQFADDGGAVRLFWMEDGMLRLWALGAGTWDIAPDDGAVTDLEEALPVLWSPNGDRRVTVKEEGGTSTITLVDEDGDAVATTTADGLVSHLRWSPGGDRVSFTLGRSTSGGGVLQNLYLWDLGDGESPSQLTSTGAAFGVEWRGTIALWRD